MGEGPVVIQFLFLCLPRRHGDIGFCAAACRLQRCHDDVILVVDRYYAVRHLSRPERPGFLFYDGAINDGGVPSPTKSKGGTKKR